MAGFDSVRADEIHTKTYCPVRSKQTVMRIIFYCTDSSDAEFIDEDDVQQLGELCVDIGKPLQGVCEDDFVIWNPLEIYQFADPLRNGINVIEDLQPF